MTKYQVLNFLIEHGPADATTIAQRIGKKRNDVKNALYDNPHFFVEVDRRIVNRGKTSVIWSAYEQ